MVEEVRNGGISITVGMVNGFVPAVHSADVPLIHPAKKFQPETKLSGRVSEFVLQGELPITTIFIIFFLCLGVES